MTQDRNVALRYFDGTRIPFEGLRLLKNHRKLWSLVLFPILMMVVVAGIGIYTLFQFLPSKISSLINLDSSGSSLFIYWALILMAFVLGFAAIGFLSVFLTKILALPFYTLLAERTFEVIESKPPLSISFQTWLFENLRMLRVSLLKALLFFLIGLFLFAVSLIPIVNFFALLGGILLISFDCMDYILEIRRLGLRQRLACFRRLLPEIFGIATVLGLFLIIPGLSFVLIPATIVGSAVFFSNKNIKFIN